MNNSSLPAAHRFVLSSHVADRAGLGWTLYKLGLATTGLLWVCLASTLCGCNSMSGWVMNESGQAYYRKGDFVTARQEFERALIDDPYRADYAYNVAKAMERQGEWGHAEQMYQYALTLDPAHELSYHGLSEMLVAQGRQDDAQMLLQAWSDTQPYMPESNLEMARWNYQNGDLASAQQNLTQALRIQPYNPRALAQLGHVYQQTGQTDAAAATYQQSLALYPYQPDVQTELSRLSWQNSAASPALAIAKNLPQMDPTLRGGVVFAGGSGPYAVPVTPAGGVMTAPHWGSPHMAAPIGPGPSTTMYGAPMPIPAPPHMVTNSLPRGGMFSNPLTMGSGSVTGSSPMYSSNSYPGASPSGMTFQTPVQMNTLPGQPMYGREFAGSPQPGGWSPTTMPPMTGQHMIYQGTRYPAPPSSFSMPMETSPPTHTFMAPEQLMAPGQMGQPVEMGTPMPVNTSAVYGDQYGSYPSEPTFSQPSLSAAPLTSPAF